MCALLKGVHERLEKRCELDVCLFHLSDLQVSSLPCLHIVLHTPRITVTAAHFIIIIHLHIMQCGHDYDLSPFPSRISMNQ